MAFRNYLKTCPDCGKPFRSGRALRRHVDGWTRAEHTKWEKVRKEDGTVVREPVIIAERAFPACDEIPKVDGHSLIVAAQKARARVAARINKVQIVKVS